MFHNRHSYFGKLLCSQLTWITHKNGAHSIFSFKCCGSFVLWEMWSYPNARNIFGKSSHRLNWKKHLILTLTITLLFFSLSPSQVFSLNILSLLTYWTESNTWTTLLQPPFRQVQYQNTYIIIVTTVIRDTTCANEKSAIWTWSWWIGRKTLKALCDNWLCFRFIFWMNGVCVPFSTNSNNPDTKDSTNRALKSTAEGKTDVCCDTRANRWMDGIIPKCRTSPYWLWSPVWNRNHANLQYPFHLPCSIQDIKHTVNHPTWTEFTGYWAEWF